MGKLSTTENITDCFILTFKNNQNFCIEYVENEIKSISNTSQPYRR